jgi:biopolymer transport protein ExbD
MSRRRRFALDIKNNSTFSLNITSMTDMFTLLLVFLLQNFSTSSVEIKSIEGLKLPTSNSYKNPVDILQVSVSLEDIRVSDKIVAKIGNRQIASADVDPQDSNFIQPLFKELQARAQDPKSKKNDDQDNGQILLQADQNLPYQTLRKVMYTASMAGFPHVKLITVVGN